MASFVPRFVKDLLDFRADAFVDGKSIVWDSTLRRFRIVYPGGYYRAFVKAQRAVDGTGFQTTPGGLYTVANDGSAGLVDPGGNYNTSTYCYRVPIRGIYKVTTKLRPADGSQGGLSYGQGAGTSAADASGFQWFLTTGSRNGSLNIRTDAFEVGDQIRTVGYTDGSVLLIDTTMTVELIAPL